MGVPYVTADPYLDANFAYLVAQIAALAPIVTATVSTTNSTPTTIATFAITTGATELIQSTVTARRTGGSSGGAGDSAAFSISAAAKNIAGTVTIIGAQNLYKFGLGDQPAWSIGYAVSGTNIIAQVTGAANNNIDWSISAVLNSVT